jgi:hypothetical protein
MSPTARPAPHRAYGEAIVNKLPCLPLTAVGAIVGPQDDSEWVSLHIALLYTAGSSPVELGLQYKHCVG